MDSLQEGRLLRVGNTFSLSQSHEQGSRQTMGWPFQQRKQCKQSVFEVQKKLPRAAKEQIGGGELSA